MGETRDFLEDIRNSAISIMEDVLTTLEDLKHRYNINNEDYSILEELIIDKGREIIQLNDSIECLTSDLEEDYKKNK